ncbi:MAG: epoxyqueuosine reductase QueH [Oscillospiraceae bacterium]|nr:epoxyqueuosine reductase QueH [Oscillospiraceae bacterium]
MNKKLLLHTCCAPCLIGSLPVIDKTGNFDISCFWYNPNIHPYIEYKSRLDALIGYTSENNINLIIKDYYGLVEFTQNVISNLKERCGYCYNIRIKETAKYAKENGFDMFSTTLLVSPYQNHEKIKEICEKYAKDYEIGFLCEDFRVNFREGQKSARDKNIYMQKYCGCIFSEQERFLRQI